MGPNIIVEWLTLLLHIWEAHVQISTRRPLILTDVFRFHQYLHADAITMSFHILYISSFPSSSRLMLYSLELVRKHR
jgi:hypothetical protein